MNTPDNPEVPSNEPRPPQSKSEASPELAEELRRVADMCAKSDPEHDDGMPKPPPINYASPKFIGDMQKHFAEARNLALADAKIPGEPGTASGPIAASEILLDAYKPTEHPQT